MQMTRIIGWVLVLATLGCSSARNVDYPPSRGISADVAASHASGPISARPGSLLRDEPYDAVPWQLGERHQSGY
jgi:hypothetical protein